MDAVYTWIYLFNNLTIIIELSWRECTECSPR